jgi:hypothetical protein
MPTATLSPNSPTTSLIAPRRAGQPKFGIETICSQNIFDLIIQDYLDRLYCLTPLLHKQAFQSDLENGRAETDPLFFSFAFSLCTWVCTMLPVRFKAFQDAPDGVFRYSSINEMVEQCEHAVLALRGQAYFERLEVLHPCISFTLAQSLRTVGLPGRSRIYHAEMHEAIIGLGAHDCSAYEFLNERECQVLKKVFWLDVFVQIHLRLGWAKPRPWLPVPDTMLFNVDDLGGLLPLPLDDEDIGERIVGGSGSTTAIVDGFLGIIEVFLCFVALSDASLVDVGGVFPRPTRAGSDHGRRSYTATQGSVDALQSMFQRVLSIDERMPRVMALWLEPTCDLSSFTPLVAGQLMSMRANIHVTRLWARYLIFDRLVTLQAEQHPDAGINKELIITEHEAVCEQLLQFLHNVNVRSLESNGMPISFKIRQVAALLLEYSSRSSSSREDGAVTHTGLRLHPTSPFNATQSGLVDRADGYIEQFLEILTRLNSSTMQDSQMLKCTEYWDKLSDGS